MIVVVADTSPLNYLVQINREHILPALYSQVLVPAAVLEELSHSRAVPAVRQWLQSMPSWLIVRVMVSEVDPTLTRLDPGEREAIQLAKHEHADLLLMDEKLGVRVAREQGLAVTGTLGVLVQAAIRAPARPSRHRRALGRSPPSLRPLRGWRFAMAAFGGRPLARRATSWMAACVDRASGGWCSQGLRVSGTLGVIRLAADHGLITLADALDRLEKTNFRASLRLLNSHRGGAPRD